MGISESITLGNSRYSLFGLGLATRVTKLQSRLRPARCKNSFHKVFAHLFSKSDHSPVPLLSVEVEDTASVTSEGSPEIQEFGVIEAIEGTNVIGVRRVIAVSQVNIRQASEYIGAILNAAEVDVIFNKSTVTVASVEELP